MSSRFDIWVGGASPPDTVEVADDDTAEATLECVCGARCEIRVNVDTMETQAKHIDLVAWEHRHGIHASVVGLRIELLLRTAKGTLVSTSDVMIAGPAK